MPVDESLHRGRLAAIAREGERFGALAGEVAAGRTAAAGWGAPVPWVPAWDVRALVAHLGTVHRWATAIVAAGTTDPPTARPQPPAEGLLDWYAEGLAGLLAVLEATDPGAPCWHMSPAAERVAASWARRQAHEVAVHRTDLEVAAGLPAGDVAPDLAEDGVDEVLTVVVPRWAHLPGPAAARATVAVTCSDTGRGWSVTLDRGAVGVVPGGTGAADAAVTGTANALLRRLWGRPAEVTVRGDRAAEALLRGR
ncbi:maleylpyruvate isomerase N-terminal domain-containing protein [Geodermatophilus marinus]|uniref:maleylpyruvate isomerase N-terminal domain-containing protein n=1 Tax=Geodermatophilus sp. LHW52908 TaxID=2303986 RepID=UPI00131469EE|nr:maleylpyruvate isomerase N-terminal domain-containing protein [Geodermatophilus sp. LHW52908]